MLVLVPLRNNNSTVKGDRDSRKNPQLHQRRQWHCSRDSRSYFSQRQSKGRPTPEKEKNTDAVNAKSSPKVQEARTILNLGEHPHRLTHDF